MESIVSQTCLVLGFRVQRFGVREFLKAVFIKSMEWMPRNPFAAPMHP